MKLFGKENQKRGLEANGFLDLDQEINTWLEQHPSIEIVDIKQSSNGGSWASTKVFISVWYEESA